jgi:hypothetical protein
MILSVNANTVAHDTSESLTSASEEFRAHDRSICDFATAWLPRGCEEALAQILPHDEPCNLRNTLAQPGPRARGSRRSLAGDSGEAPGRLANYPGEWAGSKALGQGPEVGFLGEAKMARRDQPRLRQPAKGMGPSAVRPRIYARLGDPGAGNDCSDSAHFSPYPFFCRGAGRTAIMAALSYCRR